MDGGGKPLLEGSSGGLTTHLNLHGLSFYYYYYYFIFQTTPTLSSDQTGQVPLSFDWNLPRTTASWQKYFDFIVRSYTGHIKSPCFSLRN